MTEEQGKVERALTLDSVCQGGLPERFQQALEKVLANCRDVNCEAEATRKITITISFRPDALREQLVTTATVKPGLAEMEPVAGVAHMGRSAESGELIAVTYDLRQLDAFRQKDSNVLPLNRETEGGGDE